MKPCGQMECDAPAGTECPDCYLWPVEEEPVGHFEGEAGYGD